MTEPRRTRAPLGALAALTAIAVLGAVAWFAQPAPSEPDPAPEDTDTPTSKPRPPAGDQPNVVILMWDTVRADRLGIYGYGLPTTPALDRFAQGATVYARAVSPAIWTPPSHASLFTGLAPKQHGVDATYKWLDNHHTTLAEILGDAGFDTYAFSSNPYVSAKTNLLQGFATQDFSFEKPWKKEAKAATESKLLTTTGRPTSRPGGPRSRVRRRPVRPTPTRTLVR